MTTATYAAQIAAIARLPDQLEALVGGISP
jgi:hypothetical protein